MSYPLFHPRSTAPLPTALSAQEFRAAFPAEDEYVEFKEGLSTKELRRAVVAFSNTDGGVIVLGALDDGSVTGFSLSSKGYAQLNKTCSAYVVDPAATQVHRGLGGATSQS
ncbi:MAG: ATP-binding protein [Rhodococcus sp.]|nr:ATP-binding protein [Rhodococcus sp. (in: high G+C Gram-positive bacteria)]